MFFVCATAVKWIFFLNHRNRKVVGGKHNVLVHYMDFCAPDLAGIVFCNPFKWDVLWFILIKNLVICVPTQLAKGILFLNHMNRKVVGGTHNVLVHYVDICAPSLFNKHNVLVYTMWMLVHLTHLLLPIYFVVQFDWKSCFIFWPATKEKWILFLNYRNRKRYRRHT